MTQFTRDTVASQDGEARGTGFGYRRLAIPGRPALVFCQYLMGTVDDHDPALSGAFASDREAILFDNARQRGRTAMTRLNVDGARRAALFASGLQRSDDPTAASVGQAEVPDTQVPFSAPSCAGAGVLARAITSRGPQRLTRGSNHDHRPAKESFHASGITHPQRATRDHRPRRPRRPQGTGK
jgi:hypothetical protein